MYSLPIKINELEEEAERMQRRFEQAKTPEEYARISEELSRRIALLAPVVGVLQRYMFMAEMAHREAERPEQ